MGGGGGDNSPLLLKYQKFQRDRTKLDKIPTICHGSFFLRSYFISPFYITLRFILPSILIVTADCTVIELVRSREYKLSPAPRVLG